MLDAHFLNTNVWENLEVLYPDLLSVLSFSGTALVPSQAHIPSVHSLMLPNVCLQPQPYLELKVCVTVGHLKSPFVDLKSILNKSPDSLPPAVFWCLSVKYAFSEGHLHFFVCSHQKTISHPRLRFHISHLIHMKILWPVTFQRAEIQPLSCCTFCPQLSCPCCLVCLDFEPHKATYVKTWPTVSSSVRPTLTT